MVATQKGSSVVTLSTKGLSEGVYFYMAVDDKGYKYTGKLFVK
jgi:hypothetical protein